VKEEEEEKEEEEKKRKEDETLSLWLSLCVVDGFGIESGI
jgi:hypothetical protein